MAISKHFRLDPFRANLVFFYLSPILGTQITMYNAQYSNNPFVDDPTISSTRSRYPDISTLEYSSSGANNGYASPSGYGYNQGYSQQTSYNPQQVQQMQVPYTQPQVQQSFGTWQQPQGQLGQYGGGSGYGTPGALSPTITGLPYQGNGFGQQYPMQQPQYTGYATSQYNAQGYQTYGSQQIQSHIPQQPNISEFDPLSQSQPQSQSQSQSQSQITSTTGRGPNGNLHPREYIRTHKQELEIWDNVSWKQALSTFGELRVAWESHKSKIVQRIQQGGYYLGAAESQRLQGMIRQAEHNVDSVTASSIQMQEVLDGYRQSSDLASKNRVRESLNAAVQSLPDWPPQSW